MTVKLCDIMANPNTRLHAVLAAGERRRLASAPVDAIFDDERLTPEALVQIPR